MSNLTKLEFVAFDIIENNYLSWSLNVEIHLDVMNLGAAIKKEIKHPYKITQKR